MKKTEELSEFLVRSKTLKQVKMGKKLPEEVELKINSYFSSLPTLTLREKLEVVFLRKTHVYEFSLVGEFKKRWDSIQEVEEKMGADHSGIIQCCQKKIACYKESVWRYYPKENIDINLENLEGIHFGKWVSISKSLTGEGSVMNRELLCKCSCHRGKERSLPLHKLLLNMTTNCGCESSRVIRPEDILGKPFGKLTVKSYWGQKGIRRHYYNCECSCGRECIVGRDVLISGKRTNCLGCGD